MVHVHDPRVAAPARRSTCARCSTTRSCSSSSRRRGRRTCRRPPAARAPPSRRCRRCGCARAPSRSGSSAGELAAYSVREALRARAASTPATSAARSNVHGSARSRSWSAPVVCSRRNASSAWPFANRYRWIASATATSVPGLTARCRSAARASGVVRGSIDDELRAALLRFAHVRDEVNARRGRVHAPEHDQLRFRIVLVGDRRHLAVQRHVRGAGRRRAHGAREPRRAEAAPQLSRRGCPASAARSIRRRRYGRIDSPPRSPSRCSNRVDDELERFVPRHALESCPRPCGRCGRPDRAGDPARTTRSPNFRTFAQM